MEPYSSRTADQDILDDLGPSLVQASTTKRFANYFVDILAFYVFVFLFSILLAGLSPGAQDSAAVDSAGFGLLERLMALLLYGLFMFLTEALFHGKSLGKLLTGTRAVKDDGRPLTVKEALLRGLCRVVPFEQFSALGSPSYPWHDRWSNTLVIDEKLSVAPDGGRYRQ